MCFFEFNTRYTLKQQTSRYSNSILRIQKTEKLYQYFKTDRSCRYCNNTSPRLRLNKWLILHLIFKVYNTRRIKHVNFKSVF